jgi:PKD repeat protein
MARSFSVTTPASEMTLDRRQGEVVFTVSNIANRAVRGRMQLTPIGQTSGTSLALVGETERDFKANETYPCRVRVGLPSQMVPGRYSFRLDVLNAADPDDDYAEGPAVAFEVDPVVEPPTTFPWWLIVLVVALMVLTISAIYFLQQQPVKAAFVQVLAETPPFIVTFTDNSTGPIEKRSWKFGDEAEGDAPTETADLKVKHTYLKPGEYGPVLTVTSKSGQTNSFTGQPITIQRMRPAMAQHLLFNTGDNKLQHIDLKAGTVKPIIEAPTTVGQFHGLTVVPPTHEMFAVANISAPDNWKFMIHRLKKTDAKLEATPLTANSFAGFMGNIISGPDGHLYLAVHDASQVLRFDETNGKPLPSTAGTAEDAIFAQLENFDPLALAFGPDKHIYLSGNQSGILQVDGTTGKTIGTFGETGTRGYGAIAFSKSGRLLAADRNSPLIYQFDAATGKGLGEFPVTGQLLTIGEDDRVYTFLSPGAEPGGRALVRVSDPTTGIVEKSFQLDSPPSGGAGNFSFMIVAPFD